MDYIRFYAHLHPHSLAIADLTTNRDWSYYALDRYIAACTALLIKSGVSEGKRVACISRNRAEIIVLHFACARIGAIFVPLNWRLSAQELAIIISDCEPSLIYGDELAKTLEMGVEDIARLHDEAMKMKKIWPGPISSDLPSLILYTSGTTGVPKGVMLSERNLAESALNFSLLGEVTSDSHFLCESPMFHIIGIVTSIRTPFFLGATIYISDRFIPERTLSRLADENLKISHYFCVPQMALSLRGVDAFDPLKLSGIKAIFTGGAPHPESQIRDWLNDGICVVDGFGMTEAGTVFGMPLNKEIINRKAGCIGVPAPRVQVRIVDDNDCPVDAGIAGELQVKGDNVMRGYWRKEEEFKASFTHDGWFKTGDILSCDSEGYYKVTGRKKDMFISGGENVYPAEVEAHLANIEGMRELAVVGVPDEKWGEVGCLFYVREDRDISLDEIDEFLGLRIAKYKIPKKIMALDEFPRNGVGKILKHKLKNI